MVETPVFEGDRLKAGQSVIGPAIFEEPTMTVVVPPKVKVSITKLGSYLMELD